MPRKVATVTIPNERKYARDIGKVFILTEMPATRAEAWATRCFLAMARGGMDIPADLMETGMQGIAVFGLRSIGNMRYEDAQPLLQEMMSCVQHMPDPQKPQTVRYFNQNGTEGDDVEEIPTLLFLRAEIFKLHTDFLQPAVKSPSTSQATGSNTRAT